MKTSELKANIVYWHKKLQENDQRYLKYGKIPKGTTIIVHSSHPLICSCSFGNAYRKLCIHGEDIQ